MREGLPSLRRSRLMVMKTALVNGSACSSHTCSRRFSALRKAGAARMRTSRTPNSLTDSSSRRPFRVAACCWGSSSMPAARRIRGWAAGWGHAPCPAAASRSTSPSQARRTLPPRLDEALVPLRYGQRWDAGARSQPGGPSGRRSTLSRGDEPSGSPSRPICARQGEHEHRRDRDDNMQRERQPNACAKTAVPYPRPGMQKTSCRGQQRQWCHRPVARADHDDGTT